MTISYSSPPRIKIIICHFFSFPFQILKPTHKIYIFYTKFTSIIILYVMSIKNPTICHSFIINFHQTNPYFCILFSPTSLLFSSLKKSYNYLKYVNNLCFLNTHQRIILVGINHNLIFKIIIIISTST